MRYDTVTVLLLVALYGLVLSVVLWVYRKATRAIDRVAVAESDALYWRYRHDAILDILIGRERDKCFFCLGARGGVRGNENIEFGRPCCDDCSVLLVNLQKEWERALKGGGA